MTLQNMRYIIEIANHHSFSEAAKALYVSQSTLSVAVREVEKILGINIFNRNNKGVTLTYDGEDFLKYAREIVEQTDYLERRYQHRQYLPMRFSVSSQRLPFATRAFNQLLNTVTLGIYDMAVRECPTYTVVHDIASNKSELGVLAVHDSHMRTIQKTLESNDISFTGLNQLPIYVFLRHTHPLADRPALSLDDLKDYAFVTYDQEINSSHFTEELLFYELLDKNIHVSDRCTKIALIRGSNCFSIGPDLPNSNAGAFHRGMGEIRAIPLKEPIEPLHVGYIMRKGQTMSSMAGKYVKLLNKELNELVGTRRPASGPFKKEAE